MGPQSAAGNPRVAGQLLSLENQASNKTSKMSFKFCLQHEASAPEWGSIKLQPTLLINGNSSSHSVTLRKNGYSSADEKMELAQPNGGDFLLLPRGKWHGGGQGLAYEYKT